MPLCASTALHSLLRLQAATHVHEIHVTQQLHFVTHGDVTSFPLDDSFSALMKTREARKCLKHATNTPLVLDRFQVFVAIDMQGNELMLQLFIDCYKSGSRTLQIRLEQLNVLRVLITHWRATWPKWNIYLWKSNIFIHMPCLGALFIRNYICGYIYNAISFI